MSRFFNLIYFSNFIIATSASLLTLYYALKADVNFHLSIPVIVFCGTFLVYHLQRIAQDYFHQSLGPELKAYYQNFKIIHAFQFILAFGVLLYFLPDLNSRQFIVLSISLLISALYIKIPFSAISLRSIPYSKPFVISIVWALVTVLLININWFHFWDSFIFILLLSIPFDIKDQQEDLSDKVVTIANKFPHHIKMILSLFATGYALFWIVKGDVFFMAFLPLYLLFILTKPNPWKYYLGLDGLIILRFIVYLYQY